MEGIRVYYNENGGIVLEIDETLGINKIVELTEALNKEVFNKTFEEFEELNSNLEFQNSELSEQLHYWQNKDDAKYDDRDCF